jgi:hypothetical protein
VSGIGSYVSKLPVLPIDSVTNEGGIESQRSKGNGNGLSSEAKFDARSTWNTLAVGRLRLPYLMQRCSRDLIKRTRSTPVARD